jgi:hypothetical protein
MKKKFREKKLEIQVSNLKKDLIFWLENKTKRPMR